MEKLILPKGKPFITTYPKDSNAVSILLNHKNTYGWLMNSFIQLTSYDNQYLDYYDFYYRNCPIIECQRFNIESVYQRYGNITTFIVEAIDNGYYPYLQVNTEYIPAYKGEIKGLSHDMLVYGYDNQTKKFYISDNFLYGKYKDDMCNFDELEEAVYNISKNDFYYNGFRHCIELLSYNKDNRTCFEPYRILASIDDYLNSEATKMWYVNHAMWNYNETKMRTFGMDCYKTIRKHTEIAEREGEFGAGSVQAFHLMWEHKNTMLRRLQYMKEQGICFEESIFEQYSMIETLAKQCLMMCLKFSISRDLTIPSKILTLYDEIQNIEKLELEKIRSYLVIFNNA